MKTWVKVLLTVGGILMVCGLVLLVAVAAMDGFREIDLFRYFSPEVKEVTHEIEEDFASVRVECVESNVVLLPSEDGTCKVVCGDSEKIYHTVSVENNILTVSRKDDRAWYERIGLFLWRDSTVTVRLPAEQYESLVAESVSGDVVVQDLILSGEGTVSSVSGDVAVRNVSGAGLRISSVSGDVTVASVSGTAVLTDSSSGDLLLSDVTAEGEFVMETVSGDLEFFRCDGGSVSIDTVSGDVSGTLLSPKKFSWDTVSGDIRVPDSSGTDPCEISTASGDVEIGIVP